jgi:hypothetical protein
MPRQTSPNALLATLDGPSTQVAGEGEKSPHIENAVNMCIRINRKESETYDSCMVQ